MRRISYLAVFAVAALGVMAYASLQHSDPLMLESTGLAVALAQTQLQTVFIAAGPILESAELDGDTLTISFDDNIELSTVDLSKLHIRERGSSTSGLTLSSGSAMQLDAGREYVTLYTEAIPEGIANFRQPSDIAVYGDNILVADSQRHRIAELGPMGGGQGNFAGGQPGDEGEDTYLQFPRSLTVNDTGHVFVADTDNHRVRIFYPDGTSTPPLVGTFGNDNRTAGNGPEQLNKPQGIALDDTGRIYVADSNNDRIQVLSPGGDYIRTLNFTDSDGNKILNNPRGIEINGTHMFVSDTLNNVIRISDLDGSLVRTLNITGDDALAGPHALSFGSEDRLFVADRGNGRIAILDTAGTGMLLDTIDGLENPRGVDVGPDGRVYVAETREVGNAPGNNGNVNAYVLADTKITLKLDTATLGTITGLSDPVLDIDRGAVSAATKENDPIAPSIDNPLVTPDSSPPGLEFDTAALDPLGRLSILFNDEIATNTADLSGLHVRERGSSSGGVMLSGGPDTPDDRFSYIGNLTAADLTHAQNVTFDSLSGLTVDPAGRIFVADASDNSTIWIFNPDGTTESFMSDFDAGHSKTANGLTFARDVAVGPEGRIFVTDVDDHMILVFERNPDGTYEHAYSLGNASASFRADPTDNRLNTDRGLILKPLGVEVDSTGHVFTGESLGSRVQVFEPGSRDVSVPLYLAGSGQGNTLDSLNTFGPGGVDTVSGITLDNAGRMIVTNIESTKDRVFILSPHAKLLHSFGSDGNGPGQFDGPRGPAVDAAGNIFIADTNNHRIQAFDKYGNYLGMAGRVNTTDNNAPIPGNGTLEFNAPRGIAVDNEGRILVSDTGNGRIQILSFTDVTERDAAGDRIVSTVLDLQNANLTGPRGVVVDSNGRIIVTDTGKDRVRIFDSEGEHVLDIGENFTKVDGEAGTFGQPWGVAVNSTNHIFVTDQGSHHLQIFDKNGEHVRQVGEQGNGDGNFTSPRAVTVDDDDNIFVGDNGRVQMFDPRGEYVVGSDNGGHSTIGDIRGLAINGTGAVVVTGGGSSNPAHVWLIDALDREDFKRIDDSLHSAFLRGVAADVHDRIWLVDGTSPHIRLFDPDLSRSATFGTSGNGTGQFDDPDGITIDSTGRILVADTGNHRIQVLSFASDGLFFDLSAAETAAIDDMTTPTLDIDAGALTGPDSTPVPAVQDGEILKLPYAGPPAIREVTVAPGNGTTVGDGGSLYVTFKSEPDLILHSNSTINGKLIKSDMMTYSGGTYTIEHTVSQGDPNVADNEALLAEITVLDVARNTATVVADGISADIAPAINSSRSVVTLEESSFSTDRSAISLRFSGPVGISDVLMLQIRDTDGTMLDLLSRDVELSVPADHANYTHIHTIGSNGTEPDELRQPSDIAINSTGYMFVADSQNHRIQVFDPDWAPERTIGGGFESAGNEGGGLGEERFAWPRGITINSTDYVLVADTNNHRLQILYPNGSFARDLVEVGDNGRPVAHQTRGGFDSPFDVAVDDMDRIFVVGDPSEFFWSLGPDARERDQFLIEEVPGEAKLFGPELTNDANSKKEGPEGVTASGGLLFVADKYNHRIVVFDPSDFSTTNDTQFLAAQPADTFGASGLQPGNFTAPRGMAVDDSGRIWVAEGGENDRLQLVTPNGTHVAFLGGDDDLDDPRGVAYDRYRLFVADTDNHRVLVYEPPVSEFAFTLSGDALAAVQRMGSPYLDVAVGTVSTLDGTSIARSHEIRPPVPDDRDDDVTDARVTVDVAVPELQDRSLVHRSGGGSGIIIDNTIVQSPGKAASVLHSINWETSNDMITLYIVTSAPTGSEPYVYLRTPDSGTVTAKVSDSQPYPGRILYEAEISASNSFAQVYVDGVSRHILLDAPDGNVQVTLYNDSDMTTSPDTTAEEPVTTKLTPPEPVIEPETPATLEPVEPVIQDDIPDTQDVEPEQVVVDPEPTTNNEQIPDDDINGCLIATAAYGTELAPQVQMLRELRDGSLLQTDSGTAFMGAFNNIYYAFSPEVSDLQRENPVFREATKLLLTPMLYTLNIMSMADDEASVLGLGLSVIALNIGMYIISPAFAGYTIYKHRKNV